MKWIIRQSSTNLDPFMKETCCVFTFHTSCSHEELAHSRPRFCKETRWNGCFMSGRSSRCSGRWVMLSPHRRHSLSMPGKGSGWAPSCCCTAISKSNLMWSTFASMSCMSAWLHSAPTHEESLQAAASTLAPKSLISQRQWLTRLEALSEEDRHTQATS